MFSLQRKKQAAWVAQDWSHTLKEKCSGYGEKELTSEKWAPWEPNINIGEVRQTWSSVLFHFLCSAQRCHGPDNTFQYCGLLWLSFRIKPQKIYDLNWLKNSN